MNLAGLGVSVVTGLLALAVPLSASAQEVHADLCLEVAAPIPEAAWDAIGKGAATAIAAHPSLFPGPVVRDEGSRLDVWAGHEGLQQGAGASCLEAGFEWTVRMGRAFLEAGADLMLAEAPTTPGIDSDVSLEWHPGEARIRTTLTFAGPLDIPNGSCWVDDTLRVDVEGGVVVASSDEGRQTSPFAEWACDRFFEHLPEGGAGEQAVNLLPTAYELSASGSVRLIPRTVMVRDDAIVIAGDLEED